MTIKKIHHHAALIIVDKASRDGNDNIHNNSQIKPR